MKSMNAIKFNVNEKITFGNCIGQTFIEIYKFNHTYLEWIIKETEVCFDDLDEFFKYGKPFDYSNLSKEVLDELINHVNENNKSSIYNGRKITYDNIKYLKDKKLIKYYDFEEIKYCFSEELNNINNKKIELLENGK